MSHPSRPWARGPAQRRRRDLRIETLQALEERVVLAPFLATSPLTAVFTAAATPTNENLGFVSLEPAALDGTFPSPAPLTSVSQLTDSSSFGGDIVRIEAGPGGDFGKGVYAISRGGGANLNAINRPGVIYRVDPATGKASRLLRPEHGHRRDRAGGHRRELLRDSDRPGQLVRPRLRSGRLLRRPPLAVHLVGRRHRPEQERRLPDRPRRLVPRRVRPVPRRHGRRRHSPSTRPRSTSRPPSSRASCAGCRSAVPTSGASSSTRRPTGRARRSPRPLCPPASRMRA